LLDFSQMLQRKLWVEEHSITERAPPLEGSAAGGHRLRIDCGAASMEGRGSARGERWGIRTGLPPAKSRERLSRGSSNDGGALSRRSGWASRPWLSPPR